MSSYRDDGPDTMIVKCPCGFWAHGRDDMVVAEIYEKHLVGCHREGAVPEPEVEEAPHPHEVMDTQRLRKLRDEVLQLADHVRNMSSIVKATASVNSRAEGLYRLAETTEDRLRSMLARSTECP